MAAISTDYATIGLVSTSSSATATGGDQGFSEVLATQLQDDSSTATATATGGAAASTTSDADLALTSYSSGQQVASAAATSSDSTTATGAGASAESSAATAGAGDSTATDTATASTDTTTTTVSTTEETTDSTASTGDTSETSTEATGETASTGWPAGVGQEWTPGNMQFYDELTGQWVDDNIPHRLNADGKLEYSWEGQWYLDTAVKHRVATDGEATQTADASAETEGDTTASSTTYSLEGTGPFTSEEYYNTALNDWSLFNLPSRENEDGSRQYYWADQWWDDSWDHRAAA